jgi:hypothetical protein
MSENLDSEQSHRLWEYRLHTESILYSRLTFFLAFETILLAVVGTLYDENRSPSPILIVLIFLGGLIALIWLYLQHNQKQIFDVLEDRVYNSFPEHKVSIDRVKEKRKVTSKLGIGRPALMLLTYGVPILITLVWVCFLFFVKSQS